MPTAIQFGQRQISFDKILKYLTSSPLLDRYLRWKIVEKTLFQWQHSPEYYQAYSVTELQELEWKIYQLKRANNIDPEQIEAVKRSMILQKYQQVNWEHRLSSYFLARKAQLDRVIFSLIQVDSLGMAQELHCRVQERRQSFERLAKSYSQGAVANIGGLIGPIEITSLHQDIVDRLINLNPGELSPVFELDDTHVFIRLEQRLPARFDDNMKRQLIEELFEQWLESEVKRIISTLEVIDNFTEELLIEARSTKPIILDSEIEFMESIDSITTNPIWASKSFFLPSNESPDSLDSQLKTSSLFLPQSFSNQLIEIGNKSGYLVFFEKFVAFWLFFSLFMVMGFATVYMFNLCDKIHNVQLEKILNSGQES